MRKLHTVFHSGYTNYTFPPLVGDGSLFSTSWPILFISSLFIIAILTSIWWCFIVVFIYICLMISDVEHLFMSLWIICMSLEKCLFRSYIFFFFLNQIVWYCIVWVLYVFWIWSLIRYMIHKYFLPFNRLPFNSVDGFLCCIETFLFDVGPLVYFYFCYCFFGCQIKKILAKTHVK